MTRLPVTPVIPPEQAILFIRQIRERFTVIALSDGEYCETVERLAENGIARSYIFCRIGGSEGKRRVGHLSPVNSRTSFSTLGLLVFQPPPIRGGRMPMPSPSSRPLKFFRAGSPVHRSGA